MAKNWQNAKSVDMSGKKKKSIETILVLEDKATGLQCNSMKTEIAIHKPFIGYFVRTFLFAQCPRRPHLEKLNDSCKSLKTI